MCSGDVWQGIVIGAAGGAVAGLVLWLVELLREYEQECRERRRVFRWLDEVTAPDDALNWRKTRSIASYNNLTEERVRYLCSHDPRIVLSVGEHEVWGVKGRARPEDDQGIARK